MSQLGHIVDSSTGKTVVEMFGPPRAEGKNDLGGALYALSEILVRGYGVEGVHGGLAGPFSWGVEFENDVFLMHPDYQDAECNCGFRKMADEWQEKNKHSGHCYSVVASRYRRSWEHANKRRDGWSAEVVFKRLSELRGIPWNNGFGCLGWCDCGRDEASKLYFSQHDHDFRCPHRLPNFWHKRSGLEVRWYKSIGRDMVVKPEGISIAAANDALRESFESIPEDVRQRAADQHEEENMPEAVEESAMATSALLDCLIKMHESEKPCWQCTEWARGGFIRKPDGGIGGGRTENGLAFTLRNPDGSCINCGTVNTVRQESRLRQRKEENDNKMRAWWSRCTE